MSVRSSAIVLVALCVLAGAAVVAGAILFVVELARYRSHREAVPPLPPEATARDRWSALVLDLIATLSVLGALVSWQATATFGSASDRGTQALQETATYQAASARNQSLIEYDARLAQVYQQHTAAESTYYEQATAARGRGDTGLAAQLEGLARIEGAEARAIHAGFIGIPPTAGPGGSQTVDRPADEQFWRDLDTDYRTLGQAHIEALTQEAASIRDIGQKLVLAGALFVVAIFCWTVARLGWLHRRLISAAPGLVAMLAAYVLLLLATVA